MFGYLGAEMKEGLLVLEGLRYWNAILKKGFEQWYVEAGHTIPEESGQTRWFNAIILNATNLHICIHPT